MGRVAVQRFSSNCQGFRDGSGRVFLQLVNSIDNFCSEGPSSARIGAPLITRSTYAVAILYGWPYRSAKWPPSSIIADVIWHGETTSYEILYGTTSVL